MKTVSLQRAGGIEPVRTAAGALAFGAGEGREWLNGPLAIDDGHQPLYTFPRDCPRILIWALPTTTAEDRARWLGDAAGVAFIEERWRERFEAGAIWRYRRPGELAARRVVVRAAPALSPLRGLWDTSLHVSGVRLRNAVSWALLPARKAIGSDGL